MNIEKFTEKSPCKIIVIFALGLFLASFSSYGYAGKCLYISSYHKGYEWSDGIELGLDTTLENKCEIDKFYMDTKRNKDKAFAEEMALKAKKYIELTKPDVVIACDDNASKYLVMPYFKNAALPFVFCGINWTAEPYGYPYSNVTGMIEISPIKALLKNIKVTLKDVKDGVFLGPDVISEHKEFELNRRIYEKEGIKITPIFVQSMDEWEKGYKKAQTSSFIILASNGGIDDWDEKRARNYVLQHSKKLTVAYHDWMAIYAMLALTKVADEQGEWAAKVALSILDGKKPGSIPVVTNRRWNIFVNPGLLAKTKIKLPSHIMRKATKVGE